MVQEEQVVFQHQLTLAETILLQEVTQQLILLRLAEVAQQQAVIQVAVAI